MPVLETNVRNLTDASVNPGPPHAQRRAARGWPGTFDLPGFTHYWSRSHQGNWVVKRKTAASRFTRAVRMVAQWCRLHRHRPIPEQHQSLCQKLRGRYAYYGITGNGIARHCFREKVKRL